LELSRKYEHLKVFENENRTVPYAMNKLIRNANGEVIVRMDAHAFFPSNYILSLVKSLYELNADNVGGVWRTEPSDNSEKAIAIAAVLSHPFGVGNSLFRIGIDKPTEVDTVPFGCYRKQTLIDAGLYDERLTRNQDIELNKRLKAKGGKIFLVPDVYSIYYSRSTFTKLMQNNFENGKWVILASYYTKSLSALSLRHFVPMFFLFYVLTVPVWFLYRWFALPAIIYIGLISYASVKISSREQNALVGMYAALGVVLLHLSYGAGSLIGIVNLLSGKRR
jgi:glycosyltransferase involved in cell wall biosynthesis